MAALPNFSIDTWSDALEMYQNPGLSEVRSNGGGSELARKTEMTVRTEFTTVGENDDSIRKAIERRAYSLYAHDGFKDGSDQEHWFRAEKALTIWDATCSFENDEVTVRIAMEDFSASTVLISISARSAVIVSLEDAPSNDSNGRESDSLRVVPLLSPSMRRALPANWMGMTLY